MALHTKAVTATTSAGTIEVAHGLHDSVGRPLTPQSVTVVDPAGGSASLTVGAVDEETVEITSDTASVDVTVFVAAYVDPLEGYNG